MAAHDRFRAWRPAVAGVTEVLHAHFVEHAYPMHVHASWTLLIVDDGAVSYDLDRHSHLVADAVTLLPPHVPHNGRSATAAGFRKRVVYLDSAQLPEAFIGRAVDQPVFVDAALRRRIHQIHGALAHPGEEFEAESRLALVAERLGEHLRRRVGEAAPITDPPLARALRDLLTERFREGLALSEAAALLHAHPAHLVRTFSREYGMSPHQYLTSLRVDYSRRLLLAGMPPPPWRPSQASTTSPTSPATSPGSSARPRAASPAAAAKRAEQFGLLVRIDSRLGDRRGGGGRFASLVSSVHPPTPLRWWGGLGFQDLASGGGPSLGERCRSLWGAGVGGAGCCSGWSGAGCVLSPRSVPGGNQGPAGRSSGGSFR